ncbi:MAG: 30S ribosomal protein S6 [Elusimicrobiota bacterium]|jgi:small subunit ribosomal protein S6|nr:30S ribosomal protein S6 [Elusimicrobiota bacterium]
MLKGIPKRRIEQLMNYELTFIVAADVQPEEIEVISAKVSKVIEGTKGEVKSIQQLGRKKLAYPIAKFYEGSYVYFEITGDGETVRVIDNFLKLNDRVIRHLIIKTKDKKEPAKLATTSDEANTFKPEAGDKNITSSELSHLPEVKSNESTNAE